jgi:hypothetical protein
MMRRENAPSIRRNALKTLPPFSDGCARRCKNNLAIGGGLKNGTFALELVAQNVGINQIAVVRDGHLAAHAIDHEGLRIFGRA